MAKKVYAPAYDLKTQTESKLALPAEVFGVEANKPLIAQAVRVYLNNQRTARAKVKSRGEVRGTTKKVWRQKGTGRARHSDRQAPIFVGGGVAHGPKGLAPKRLKLTKKMRRQALYSVLSQKAQDNQILILKNANKLAAQTKAADQLFKQLGPKTHQPLADLAKNKTKVLMIYFEPSAKFKQATANLSYLIPCGVNQLNAYNLLRAKQLVFTQTALDQLIKIFVRPA